MQQDTVCIFVWSEKSEKVDQAVWNDRVAGDLPSMLSGSADATSFISEPLIWCKRVRVCAQV